MSLRFALLSMLLDCDASGYDLAKRFDASVANFWHALPQQLYQELGKMEDDGLVESSVIVQSSRPNKRVYSVNAAGRDALSVWLDEPPRRLAEKDALLVKIYASDLKLPGAMIAMLERHIAARQEKLAGYECIAAVLTGGADEAEYLHSSPRIGPYLTLKRGIAYERETVAWARWAIEALQLRPQNAPP